MNMIAIRRSGEYPVRLGYMEGAVTDFLTAAGNRLVIGMPRIGRSEAQAVRKGRMKAGLIKDGPMILWVFEFPGKLIFGCPFDARLISKERRHLQNVTNEEQCPYIEVHIVESETNIVVVLRAITFPANLSRDFISAVRNQLVNERDTAPIIAKYNTIDILRLPKLAALQACG